MGGSSKENITGIKRTYTGIFFNICTSSMKFGYLM